MKRVLIIAYSMNPNDVSEAVVAAYWVRFISQWREIDVITIEQHRKDIEAGQWNNARFYYVQDLDRLRRIEGRLRIRGLSIRKFYRDIERILDTMDLSEFQFIHCLTPFGIYAYNDLYRRGLPVLVGPLGGGLATPRGFGPAFRTNRFKSWARDTFYSILLKRRKWRNYVNTATKIVVGTEYVKQLLPSKAQAHTEVVFDSTVDTELFSPDPAVSKGDDVGIIFVGRLDPNKGPLILLEAIRQCVREGLSGIRVEFCGSGGMREEIETFVASNELSGVVRVWGQLERPALLERMRSASIYCLPTLREPGGNAILEAMACELPVITSDYGGPKYIVDESCGIKIAMTDYATYVSDLASAIKRLAADEDLRGRMGTAGRRRVIQEFSIAALERRIHELYDRMSATVSSSK